MLHVLISDPVQPLIPEELTRMGYACHFFRGNGKEELLKAVGDADGIVVRSRTRVDRALLLAATRLKFIARVGAGMDNIDTGFAAERGIVCLNSPEGNRDAVGEHALGMLLSMMNHLNRADRQVKSGSWIREGNRGTEIKGKTIGIIGYGNMGGAFARRLRGFEARVMAFDKYKSGYSDEYVLETTLEELFTEADIVSLHIPLTDETAGMVNDQFLGRFRQDFWLVNTSRGPVVRTADLVRHLASGHVRGAALDVLEYEEASFESLNGHRPAELQQLMQHENVILTPHIAGWTHESEIRLAQVLVEKIRTLGLHEG